MHLGVKELPKIMRISTGTLFAGRRGDNAVTAKTWHKLEAAERAVATKSKIGAISQIVDAESAKSVTNLNHQKRNDDEKLWENHEQRIAVLEDQVRFMTRVVASLLPAATEPRASAKKKT